MVGMVQTESTTWEITLGMIVQNQGLAIVTTNNTYASIADILQRDLQIEPGEATIWSRLDALGQISARLMIHRPLYGNWVMITLEFGSHNIIIQYFDPTTIPSIANTPHSRTAQSIDWQVRRRITIWINLTDLVDKPSDYNSLCSSYERPTKDKVYKDVALSFGTHPHLWERRRSHTTLVCLWENVGGNWCDRWW